MTRREHVKLDLDSKAKFAASFWDRLLGLINPANPRILLLRTRFGIHTLFLKKPIDVLILNKEFKVVALKKNLKPYRVFFWNPKYEYVLEMPGGSILHTKTELDDLYDVKALLKSTN